MGTSFLNVSHNPGADRTDNAGTACSDDEEDAEEFEEEAPRSPEEIEDARRMLRACGIGEPTRSQLLALEWITEEYISAWRKNLDEHPGPHKWNAGLLILRLRSQEWPPRSSSYGNQRRSYSDGEFADFIEP